MKARTYLLGLPIALALLTGQLAANPLLREADDCLGAPYAFFGESQRQETLADLMRNLRGVLKDFPSLLTTLETQHPKVCLSDTLVSEKAYYDVENNRIVLAEGMSPGLVLAVLVHELRHVDQVTRGVCPSQNLAMKQYAKGVFAMEADASVIALLVAWNHKEEGEPALWQALASWPMAADIAARFEVVMTQTQGDVAAAAAAGFEQWYASDQRRDRYYVASCSAYLDYQDKTHLLPGYLQLSGDYFARLCVLPDGKSYACAEGP